jgi:hypothetical protein
VGDVRLQGLVELDGVLVVEVDLVGGALKAERQGDGSRGVVEVIDKIDCNG